MATNPLYSCAHAAQGNPRILGAGFGLPWESLCELVRGRASNSRPPTCLSEPLQMPPNGPGGYSDKPWRMSPEGPRHIPTGPCGYLQRHRIPCSPRGYPQRPTRISPQDPEDIPRGRHGYPQMPPRISPDAPADIRQGDSGETDLSRAKKKTSSPLSRPSVLKIDDKPRGGPTDWAEKRKTSGRRKTETPPADIPRGLHGYPKSPPRISPAADIPNGPNGQSQRDRGCLGRPLWNCP